MRISCFLAMTASLFTLCTAPSAALAQEGQAIETFKCESMNNSRNECNYRSSGVVTVHVNQQLSHASCDFDRSWGTYDGGVWVDRGCRAEFVVRRPPGSSNQYQSSSNNGPREWDRGCEDAKVGSYDRSRHTDEYEQGWQSCNNQGNQSSDDFERKEWERGCEDAKVGSYDRSQHTDEYEEGWQDCNKR